MAQLFILSVKLDTHCWEVTILLVWPMPDGRALFQFASQKTVVSHRIFPMLGQRGMAW